MNSNDTKIAGGKKYFFSIRIVFTVCGARIFINMEEK